ncbi:MAG: DNA primase [Eubacterium sp.]|jgi:DNA primase, catalytic core|nr:DNA primase [Eubacterium sp.]
MFYEEDFVEEVRQRNDVVDVISSYVNLKRTGSSYVGLCPFHNEKTASFSVSPGKQMYYCFGCGAGGNVFTFLMEYENLTFVEALEELAGKAGMELPRKSSSPEDRRKRDMRDMILQVNKLAANYFYAQLRSERGKIGFDYLTGRGISPKTVVKFGLGYSDSRLYRYMKEKGYQDAVLKETGLFTFDEKKGPYDKFWNRVMFPILDRNNRVIAFGGRVMGDAKPKYLNSPETLVFDKSRNLYGLNFVHGRQTAMIICEGYMDVIALHQAGFANAVASLGTAFTSQHCSLLKRYTDLVYLCYDSDGAGVKAAMRAIPMMKEAGLQVKVIDMRPYKDPDEFIRGLSPEAFQERIRQAKNSFFYELDQVREEYDMDDPESKTRFMNEAAKKCLTFDNEIERNNYMEAFAREYNVRIEDFRKLAAYHSAQLAGIDYEKRRRERGQPGVRNDREDGIARSQGIFLTWLSNDPVLFERTKDIISAEDFVDEPYRQVAGMMYEQFQNEGAVRPAVIISRFQSREEQSLVAGIFNKELQEITRDEEQKKALNEVIRSIKKYSLDYRSRHVTDLKELQELIEEKKRLQTLQIKL